MCVFELCIIDANIYIQMDYWFRHTPLTCVPCYSTLRETLMGIWIVLAVCNEAIGVHLFWSCTSDFYAFAFLSILYRSTFICKRNLIFAIENNFLTCNIQLNENVYCGQCAFQSL